MHLSPARDNGRAHADRRDQERITAIDRERVDHCDRFRWPCGGALSFARNGKTFRFQRLQCQNLSPDIADHGPKLTPAPTARSHAGSTPATSTGPSKVARHACRQIRISTGAPSTVGTAKDNRNLCLADVANPAHLGKSPIDDNAHLSSYDYMPILSANADI